MLRFPHRHALLGASALALTSLALSAGLAACATAPKPTAAASTDRDPGDYVVQNPTSCFARVMSVGATTPGSLFVNDSQVLATLGPGEHATVTVPANRRLSVLMSTTANPEPNAPGIDCSRSGKVRWSRVAAGD